MAAFDRVFVHERRRSIRSIVGATAGHLLVAAVVIVSSLITVEEIDDPRTNITISFFDLPEPPETEPPRPRREYELPQETPAPEPEPEVVAERLERIEFKPAFPEPEIEIPQARHDRQKLELTAERLRQLAGTADVPELAAPLGAARAEPRPAAALVADAGGRATSLSATLDAPEVVVPGGGRGGPGLPAREPGFQVRAGGSGSSIKAYPSAGAPTMTDYTVPAPGPRGVPGGKAGGGAPGLLSVAGAGAGGGAGSGGTGLRHGGPVDAPGGSIGAFRMSGRPGRGGGSSRIAAVRASLSQRYGLPLVSVNDLGQRSTDAARWNMLVPQLSDLLRKVLARGAAPAPAPRGAIASVRSDGGSLVIQYADGVVHVLVPTEDGLMALFVARGADARPVVSKVQEAENALDALVRLGRGES